MEDELRRADSAGRKPSQPSPSPSSPSCRTSPLHPCPAAMSRLCRLWFSRFLSPLLGPTFWVLPAIYIYIYVHTQHTCVHIYIYIYIARETESVSTPWRVQCWAGLPLMRRAWHAPQRRDLQSQGLALAFFSGLATPGQAHTGRLPALSGPALRGIRRDAPGRQRLREGQGSAGGGAGASPSQPAH